MTNHIGWLSFLVFLSTSHDAKAQTAATCSQTDVNNAVNAAAVGATINVPAGSCSWSSLTISKGVTLQGAGIGKTNIALTGQVTLNKASAVMRIDGISFSVNGGGDPNKPIFIGGSWLNAKPIVFTNDAFNVSGSGLFRIGVPGGVIYSHDTFVGGWDDSFLQLKDPADSQGSWTHADSMGTHDTNGTMNIYIEDSNFTGGTNQGIDCDDACRMVNRHNVFNNSESNSHGDDSSPFGMRHFEVYNNQFNNSRDSSQLSNENQAVWIRGGTGMIYNNFFADLAGNTWGSKPEIRLNIRGAEDDRPQGSCSQVSYPVTRQLGQSYNGSSYFTDPIYIWGNTGTVGISADWEWGNPCGFSWSTFFQWGRDGVNNGTAKPGYTAYTYPHPLASGGSASAPSAPTNVHVQ
jgi:hypothetical protein